MGSNVLQEHAVHRSVVSCYTVTFLLQFSPLVGLNMLQEQFIGQCLFACFFLLFFFFNSVTILSKFDPHLGDKELAAEEQFTY